MKLEHVALLVADPVAVATWYEAHLGMRVVRTGDAPGNARFLADEAGRERARGLRGDACPCRTTRRWTRSLLHVAFAARRRGCHAGAAARGGRDTGR